MSVARVAPTDLDRRFMAAALAHFGLDRFRTGRTIDWDFIVDGVFTPVKMAGKVSVNDAEAYLDCALQGFGLIQLPLLMALPHLESGALKEVLPHLTPSPMPISVAYLQNRHLSPRVRVFIDWLAELFAEPKL
mgnify:CR=1 FL=1